LTLIDVIAFLVVKTLNVEFVHRYTRVVRVLFYINFNEAKELRRAFRNVRRTLPDVLNVFILFLASLIVFSFLGWQAFRREYVIHCWYRVFVNLFFF
jgi:two pore calcium channel protein 3